MLSASVAAVPASTLSKPHSATNGIPPWTLPPFVCAAAPLGAGQFIVDGTNLLFLNRAGPQLEIVVAIATFLAAGDYDFVFVFDANTPFTLRTHQGRDRELAYEALTQRYSGHFVEVTGGTRADDLVLPLAEVLSAQVLSNDGYKLYEDRYPWVTDRRSNRVVRVNAARDYAFIGHRAIFVEPDIGKAMSTLKTAMVAA